MKKLLKWGGIAVVVIIVLAAIGGSGSGTDSSAESSTTSTTSAEKKQEKEEKRYAVGESIPADKLEVTVTAVGEKNQVGGQYFNEKASEGATLVTVNWKYKNVSEKPVGSFSQPSIKLVDAKGTEYDWDLGKSSTYATELDLDSKVLSDLNPGITVNDAKVFEISKESYAQSGWSLKVSVSGKSYIVEL